MICKYEKQCVSITVTHQREDDINKQSSFHYFYFFSTDFLLCHYVYSIHIQFDYNSVLFQPSTIRKCLFII